MYSCNAASEDRSTYKKKNTQWMGSFFECTVDQQTWVIPPVIQLDPVIIMSNKISASNNYCAVSSSFQPFLQELYKQYQALVLSNVLSYSEKCAFTEALFILR